MLMFMGGCLFVSMIQPMIMISMMIFIVLLYSYLIYKIINTYWMSYALVMVMLSGVMVLFTYMISLFPNESFESHNLIYVFSFMLMSVGLYMYNYMFDVSYMTFGLWISFVSMYNLFVVIFLLSIMLMVVWFSYMDYGAIRVF